RILAVTALPAQLQHSILVSATRLEGSGVIVMLFRGLDRAVTENTLGDVDMRGILGRNGCRRTVPEQMGTEFVTELDPGQLGDLVVDRALAHRRAVPGNP